MQLVVVVLGIATLALAFLTFTFSRESQSLKARYSTVIDVDATVTAAKQELDRVKDDLKEFRADNDRRRTTLKGEYQSAVAKYNDLKKEIALLEENVDDISFGVYKPHFSFQTSAEYKTALEGLRDEERALIHAGRAATCPTTWTVGGSAKEGARMVKLNEKLLLRAFNGECDAALANVSWNNITKMEERIQKSFDAVNTLGDVVRVAVTKEYLTLKLKELRLTHEYEQKRYQEREEQRRIREEHREEEKARQEIEEAREDAETEEARFQKALEKAREEAAKATGAQLQKLTDQIQSFESKLDEARKKKERAISRAQLTRSGFVYVISNIGSFGEQVYKIGMTRRMEPMERIFELGGASVPFPFDLHVMMFSNDAPELEGALHQLFDTRRINLVNPRREFYRDVKLSEIKDFVNKRGLSAQFSDDAEAREYRESLARRAQEASKAVAKPADAFSEPLFSETPADGNKITL